MNYVSLSISILKSQISAIAFTFASLLTLVVLTRNTEVSVFGQYAIIISIVTMLTKFVGLNTFFFYRNQYPLISYPEALLVFRRYLPFVMTSGLSVAVLIVAVNLFGVHFMPLEMAADYGLWFVLVAISLLNFEILRFYQSIGRYLFGAWMVVFAKAVALVLLLQVAYLQEPLSLRAVVVALVGAQFANLFLQLFCDRRFLAILRPGGVAFEWRSVLAGLALIPSGLFSDGIFFFDRIAISQFVGYETAGHYSLASQGVVILYSVMGGTIITLFYPKLVSMKSRGQGEDFKKTAWFLLLSGTILCLLGALCILIFGRYVPVLFGEEYNESINILKFMMFVPLLLFLLSYISHIVYLYNFIKSSAAMYTIGIPVNLLLNLFLVREFGLFGAIASSYMSLVFLILMQGLILLRRRRGEEGELR